MRDFKFYIDQEFVTSELGETAKDAYKKARLRLAMSSSETAETRLNLLKKCNRAVPQRVKVEYAEVK